MAQPDAVNWVQLVERSLDALQAPPGLASEALHAELAKLAQFDAERYQAALLGLQPGRSEFVLQHFVVGQHLTGPRQWNQCLMELRIKHQTLRTRLVERRQLERQLCKLRSDWEQGNRSHAALQDEIELLELRLEGEDLTTLQLLREFLALNRIWRSFPQDFTLAEIEKDEENYWRQRLERQALADRLATGQVGVGNVQALLQGGFVPLGEDRMSSLESLPQPLQDPRLLLATQTEIVSG